MERHGSVLIVTSVASMVDQFLMPDIMLLQELGYVVDVATNFVRGSTCTKDVIDVLYRALKEMEVCCYQVDFERDIFRILRNMRAYRQLENIIQQKKYAFVHCHSPIGGLLGRIAAKRNGIKTIYTAHGFHFYDGAPLSSWILYYSAEKILSCLTDVLITVNREDFQRARSGFYAKRVEYIHGVGVNVDRFLLNGKGKVEARTRIRKELGLKDGEKLILSVGELNGNKNHGIVIDALHEIEEERIEKKFETTRYEKSRMPQCNGAEWIYAICGTGEKGDYYKKKLMQYGMEERVVFLGYRKDMPELYAAADLFILPSKREGISVALMEAVAAGCPVLCSDIRGNREVVPDSACRFPAKNKERIKAMIRSWMCGKLVPDTIRNFSILTEKYVADHVRKEMRAIYRGME